ncbi:cupin [Mucilaginibacter sp. R11]|uniref:Cupin n=1 Tax=Mucilaginibacter agri TaxID=2695265 RepID=A0A965ZET3_9SPHI|nr:cupin [Mucilaginibacter agri]
MQQILLSDDGIFPNSDFPVLFYPGALHIPDSFPAKYVARIFYKHGWSNSWDAGIFEYHHYHSITHEVLGVYSGETALQLGGEQGPILTIKKGDVLIIPAGVAHKNLGAENCIGVVGAYPHGMKFNVKYGEEGERPEADHQIQLVPIPTNDPLYAKRKGLVKLWK